MDDLDQAKKGDEYQRRAADAVRGWAAFCGDYEKAIQLLEKASCLYKPEKAFDKLAAAQMKIARCYLKMGKVEEGASTYVTASKYFKKVPHQGAVTALSRAAMLYEELGQVATAGRYHQELGETYEAQGKSLESMQHFGKAAQLHLAHDSNVLSNQCRFKVAKHAAELERYPEAISTFEELATDAVTNGLPKKSAREMFLYAGLCHLCCGYSGAAVKQVLQGYQETDPTFSNTRECKTALYLATASEKGSYALFAEVLKEYEVLFRNDPVARLLVNRAQKKLKCMPLGLTSVSSGKVAIREVQPSEEKSSDLEE